MENSYEAECPDCGAVTEVEGEEGGEATVICRKCRCEFTVEFESKEDAWEVLPFSLSEQKEDKAEKDVGIEGGGRKRKARWSTFKFKHYVLVVMLLISSLSGFAFALSLLQSPMIFESEGAYSGVEGTLFGSVLDPNGNGIEEAEITLEEMPDITVQTDESGYFIMEGIKEGTYTLTVYKNDYKEFRTSVLVEAGRTTAVELTLMQGEGEVTEGCFSSAIKTPKREVENMNQTFGFVVIFASFMNIIAMICVALMRFFPAAVLGSLIGALSFGFYVGSFMALGAFAIIILSKGEFD